MYIFLQNYFPTIGNVNWDIKRLVIYHINEYIERLGYNFKSVMPTFFNEFKERMYKRYKIPPQLVEKYKDDVFFLVDTDTTLVQAIQPRVSWIEPMEYEINIDQAIESIET